MKKIIIIVVFLLVLVGGAVAAMKFLGIGPMFATEGEKAAGEEAPPAEPPRFVDLEPLIIPLFQGDKLAGTVNIQLKLETIGADNEKALVRLLPRLNNAFLVDMHGYVPRLFKKEERLDIEAIRTRLQYVGDKIAGEGVIGNVLVQSVVDAPPK